MYRLRKMFSPMCIIKNQNINVCFVGKYNCVHGRILCRKFKLESCGGGFRFFSWGGDSIPSETYFQFP